MTNKRLIALFLVLCMFMCCIGCSNGQSQNSTIPNNETVIGDPTDGRNDATNTIPTNETTNNVEDAQNIVKGDGMVWDKPETQITLETIKLNEEWDKFIAVDGAIISAIDHTDMSVINNYYYGENDSYADLQTAYYVPTYRLSTMTDEVDLDKYITSAMDIVCTTNNTENNKHAVIEEVRFVTTINPYEGGGIDALKAKANYKSDGCFGIGSGYDYIVSIIGEAKTQTTVPMDVGISITTCVYFGENAEMILTFIWIDENGIDSAALTSVNWIATAIGQELHTQEGIEMFEKYNSAESNSQIDNITEDESASTIVSTEDTQGESQ